MADAILYGSVQGVLNNLGSRALNEIASTWGFKDQLNKLKITVNMIKDVLLDAEERQADSHAVRSWLARLATIVYAADDLFDEFNTIASRKQLLSGNSVTKEVKTFFSDYNQIVFAFKISRKIRSIREELEVIFQDGKVFNLAQRALEHGNVITGRSDQTYSYVDVEEVIGREADKNAILELLLSSDSTENEHDQVVLHVLPIVGIGGMGKTTLAQLIYNDPQVQKYFELKLWVCVAEDFEIKLITEKILRSATNTETPKLDMDQLHSRLRNEVGGKKYLLVLDDVWEENPNKWEDLRALLKIGRNGSKILVTTRSMKVADIMRTFPPHQLQGLSEEKSWGLFEKMAFKSGDAQQKPDLVQVGKEILKKCANVPLAIKTLGGLLRCEDESKWLSFKDKNLVEVMDVLKLSYQHLLSPLKNCFAYCALFPKDYYFDKEKLIELWMAEGFILPVISDGQSLEDVADEYYFNLLQRGFFQDVKRNALGDITSFKMHDLMHDLSQQVAEDRCKRVKFSELIFGDKILHLSFYDFPMSWEPKEMLNLNMLRTVLISDFYRFVSGLSYSIYQQVITKFRHLRVLDLHQLELKNLPRSIDKLVFLRYLNLSSSNIVALPDSITNLYNLQTLNLWYCRILTTLPKNIQKLVNLRNLDIRKCSNLTYMPSGIGKLTSLCKLPEFIVNDEQSLLLRKKHTSTATLSDLKKHNNLKGELSIRIHNSSGNNISEALEPDIMSNKHRLVELFIVFYPHITYEISRKKHCEAVLECLKPHCNLRKLQISNYGGENLPSWAVKDNLGTTLPNLVQLILWECRNCQQVPSFSQLRFLKTLVIHEIESVLYMESDIVYASPSSESQGIQYLFFPSLEELVLDSMINLRGWWEEVAGTSRQQHDHHLSSLQFLKLSKLTINGCPNLILLPLCPNLEELELKRTNKKLSLVKMAPFSSATTSASMFPSSGRSSLKLKQLKTDDVEDLISLSQLGLGPLSSLELSDDKVESTEILEEVFATVSTSLVSLQFIGCNSLRSISTGLEHLTALEDLGFQGCKLEILSSNEATTEVENEERSCDKLEVSSTEAAIMMPWKAFKANLRRLALKGAPKALSLPSGFQSLTNLHYLYLDDMDELRELPEWISCLSSLETLELDYCPKLTSLPQGFQSLTSLNELHISDGCYLLKERCRSPDGMDWPKIKHIPRIYVEGVLQNKGEEQTR